MKRTLDKQTVSLGSNVFSSTEISGDQELTPLRLGGKEVRLGGKEVWQGVAPRLAVSGARPRCVERLRISAGLADHTKQSFPGSVELRDELAYYSGSEGTRRCNCCKARRREREGLLARRDARADRHGFRRPATRPNQVLSKQCLQPSRL
jgi:hypothetical protein